MATRTEISNMALSHLAIGKPISNWESDASVEAEALRRFYKPIRDAMLREVPWSFAKKYTSLALVDANPVAEWEYSYQIPADCLFFRRVRGATRYETYDTKVPFERVGQFIYCDESPCNAEYTHRIEDDRLLPGDFVAAFALRLAMEISPRVIMGDNRQIVSRITELYAYEFAIAKHNDANEEGFDTPQDCDYIRART